MSIRYSFYSTVFLLMHGVVADIAYAEDQQHTVQRREGFVPSEQVAIQIAYAVLVPIYGEEIIEREKPFTAILKNDVWYVTGTLPKSKFPKGVVKGGVALVEISKKDGRIIRVAHGK